MTSVVTFDQIIPSISEILGKHGETVGGLEWLVVNRDLNGRVRFVLPEKVCVNREVYVEIYEEISKKLKRHAYDPENGVIYEESLDAVHQGALCYKIDGFDNVWLVDRLATEGSWSVISPESNGACRIVFFSIKGGVGRSTALAATAWSLAQSGKRVLVLDLDLASPGLSSALLPEDRMPMYGIVDWLIEDLVENSDPVFESMYASSNLSHDGQIYVVPAHGSNYGEYVSKLGRVWMSKAQENGGREIWSTRLNRLVFKLEKKIEPDIILIDSRSGIDEIASACITDMGANLVLLFALEGMQTWNGYRMLFDQWLRSGVAKDIRTRLQVVGAMVPEVDRISYITELRESSYNLFYDLYDEIAPVKHGAVGCVDNKTWQVGGYNEGWNFDEFDPLAPHCPWEVNWNSGFFGLFSFQGRQVDISREKVWAVFGGLLEGVHDFSNSWSLS